MVPGCQSILKGNIIEKLHFSMFQSLKARASKLSLSQSHDGFSIDENESFLRRIYEKTLFAIKPSNSWTDNSNDFVKERLLEMPKQVDININECIFIKNIMLVSASLIAELEIIGKAIEQQPKLRSKVADLGKYESWNRYSE
jgi:hypothetical protein